MPTYDPSAPLARRMRLYIIRSSMEEQEEEEEEEEDKLFLKRV